MSDTRPMNTSTMRRAEDVDRFPYWVKNVSWILIAQDGTITNPKAVGERDAALLAARDGATLLISWPGQWSTDTFVVTDPATMPTRSESR